METQSINLQNPNQEEEKPENILHCNGDDDEEALSLRDLPLTNAVGQTTTEMLSANHRDPAEDHFEFLSSSSEDLSPAEELIFRGRLIPLNDQNALRNPSKLPPKNSTPIYQREENERKKNDRMPPRNRIRSESLSAIQGDDLSRSKSISRDNGDIKHKRHSRSLDYRKLNRVSSILNSPSSESDLKFIDRNSSVKSTAKSDTASFGGKGVRPRWYVIMFGMIKVPPEIELRDIKSRQIRRNAPHGMFTSPPDRRSGNGSRSSSWRFLKALSCKEPTSVAATTPFWLPHA